MSIKTSACRSCGISVYWLHHATTGKLAPIDVLPTDKGNCTINELAGTYFVLAPDAAEQVRKAYEGEYTPPLHTNHFVTCAHAKIWHKAVQS